MKKKPWISSEEFKFNEEANKQMKDNLYRTNPIPLTPLVNSSSFIDLELRNKRMIEGLNNLGKQKEIIINGIKLEDLNISEESKRILRREIETNIPEESRRLMFGKSEIISHDNPNLSFLEYEEKMMMNQLQKEIERQENFYERYLDHLKNPNKDKTGNGLFNIIEYGTKGEDTNLEETEKLFKNPNKEEDE